MHDMLRLMTERAGVFATPRMRTIRSVCVLLLLLLPALWCQCGLQGQPSVQQSKLTSTLKVQTRKGCLLGLLLVFCRGISVLGSFLCAGLACWPCISSLGRKPPKAAVLQLLRDR